jgi:hypothetical protein
MNPTEPNSGAGRPSHPQLFEATPGAQTAAQPINILASIDKRTGSQASSQSRKRPWLIWALCALPVLGVAAFLFSPSAPTMEPLPISKVTPLSPSASSAVVVTLPSSAAATVAKVTPPPPVPTPAIDAVPVQVAKVAVAPAQTDTQVATPKLPATTKHARKPTPPKAVALKKSQPVHLAKHSPKHDPKHKDKHQTQVAKVEAKKIKRTETKVAVKTPVKPAKPQPQRTPEADVDLLASLLPHVNRPQNTAPTTTRTSLVAQLCEQLTGQEQIDCRVEYCKNRKGEDLACSAASLQPAALTSDK